MTASIATTTEPAATDAITALQAAVPRIAAWLQYRAWYTRVPGVQYAIWFDGAVQTSGAFGFADLAGGRRMTDRHLFRVASHSKTFTATAVLQLAERGTLRLDDRVAEHLPELAGTPAGAVTVRELLEHGGGILRDGVDSDHWQHARPFPDEARLIEIAQLDGIKAQPNERFGYSNIGYSLLGLIVARASGIPFREYLAANIAEPLGLRDTTADLVADRGADYATGYSGLHTARDRMPIPHVDTGAMSAATGVTSTARDLVRYLAAHRVGSGELLSDESKRLQQRGLWRSGDDADQEYGLGFVIERIAGRRVIGHSGGYPGHITKSLIDPEDGIAVSVLTNAVDGPASELAAGVFTMLDAALQRSARLSFTAPREPVDATRFEGRFANLWGVLDVFRLGERLLAHSPTAPAPLTRPIELTVEDDTTLRVTAGDGYGAVGETLTYEFDADGTAVSLRGAGGMSWWPFDVDADGFRVPWVQRGE